MNPYYNNLFGNNPYDLFQLIDENTSQIDEENNAFITNEDNPYIKKSNSSILKETVETKNETPIDSEETQSEHSSVSDIFFDGLTEEEIVEFVSKLDVPSESTESLPLSSYQQANITSPLLSIPFPVPKNTSLQQVRQSNIHHLPTNQEINSSGRMSKVSFIIPENNRRSLNPLPKMRELFTLNKSSDYIDIAARFYSSVSKVNVKFYRADVEFIINNKEIKLNISLMQFILLFHYFPKENVIYIRGESHPNFQLFDGIVGPFCSYETVMGPCQLVIDGQEYTFPFVFFLIASDFHFSKYFKIENFIQKNITKLNALHFAEFPACLGSPIIAHEFFNEIKKYLPSSYFSNDVNKNSPFYRNLKTLCSFFKNIQHANYSLNKGPNQFDGQKAVEQIEKFFSAPQNFANYKETNQPIQNDKITRIPNIPRESLKNYKKDVIVLDNENTIPETIDLSNEPSLSSGEIILSDQIPHLDEVANISNENVRQLQNQLFNNVVETWRKNKKLFIELNQALLMEYGNGYLFVDTLSNDLKEAFFNPFLKFMEKNRNHQKEAIISLRNFLDHFGIVCKTLNFIPEPLKKAFRVIDKPEIGNLSIKYGTYLIPSYLEFKIQQFPRKTNLVKANAESNLSIPCGVIKVHQAKAIIIPAVMNVYREENSTWNDDIHSLKNDSEKSCYNYIKSKLSENEEISEIKNGIIEISLNGVKELYNLIKTQENVDFYFLPYTFKVSKKEELISYPQSEEEEDFMEIDEVEEISQETIQNEDFSNKKVLGKRKKQVISVEEISTELLNNNSKIAKNTESSTVASKSSKTKNKRAVQNNNSEFDLETFNSNTVKKNQTQDGVDGDLVNIRDDSISEEKKLLDLNVSLFDFFAHTLSEASQVIEKNRDLFTALELGKIEYPIVNQLALVPKENVEVFPYIRILKNYQQDVVNTLERMSQGNIHCLVSLAMGLGKTPIYMSLIIDAIAKKESGISVIIVPAATRKKTLKELYFWFSEMKSTAYLALSNQKPNEFTSTWFYHFCRAQESDFNELRKLTYWEQWRPLLLSIHRVNLEKLPSGKLNQDQVSINLEAALYEHLRVLVKKKPELREKLKELENFTFDENGLSFPSHIETLKDKITFVQEVMKLLHPDFKDLSSDAFLEDAQLNRLLKFDFKNFSRISKTPKKQKQKKRSGPKESVNNFHYKPLNKILENENSILIVGYEELKNCFDKMLEEERNIFNTPTRIVIADEAQKYHSKGSDMNKLMKEYSEALVPFGAHIIPVTATPFENKIDELMELLVISNPQYIRHKDIKPIKSLMKKAVESFSDTIIQDSENNSKIATDLIIKSFVQSYILSELLKQIVVSLKFESPNVIQDWQDLLPKAQIKKYVIPYENENLLKKVKKATEDVFSRKKESATLNILSLGPCIKRLETDCNLNLSNKDLSVEKAKGSYLKVQSDNKLQELIRNLPDKIDDYINGNVEAIKDHFIAKICIEHPEISEVIKNENKIIIGYEYQIEASMLNIIISKYHKKRVFTFGENDKVRNKNLKDFENCQEPAVLLLPVKAGGVGLNLGYVNHMILINYEWNPAVQQQFFYRILRVGRGGVRNIHTLSYNNAYNDFIKCLSKEKMRAASFYLDKTESIEEKFDLFMKLLLKKSLRNFLLSSSKPGFYPINQRLFPVLTKSEDENHPQSLQKLLKNKINQIKESIDFKALEDVIEKATYKGENTIQEENNMEIEEEVLTQNLSNIDKIEDHDRFLNQNEWRIIPFHQNRAFSLQDYAKLANFINDPNNFQIVKKHLNKLICCISSNENQKVINLVRKNGDKGLEELWNIVKKDPTIPDQASPYNFTPGRFELDMKQAETYSQTNAKLYLKEESNGTRIDMLVPKEFLKKFLG